MIVQKFNIRNAFSQNHPLLFPTAGDNGSGSICIFCGVWLYFDPLKLHLKAMPHPSFSGSKQIWIGSFRWGTKYFLMSIGCKDMDCQSWWSKNILDLLVSRLHFCKLYSESLLSGRPGFESRTLQTLRLCSFVALWSIRSYTTSFESPIIHLLGLKSLWS